MLRLLTLAAVATSAVAKYEYLPHYAKVLQQIDVDVLVYGATPAGIAAAVTVANNTKLRVALLEESALVGGMAGPGGIGLRDIDSSGSVLALDTSVLHRWLHMNDVYYNTSSTVWQPEQNVAQAHWDAIVNDPAYGIIVSTQTGLLEAPGALQKSGTTITSIATVNTATEDPSNVTVWTAKVFIDASYEGVLVVASGASWTYGRESRDAYNETLAGVQPLGTFSQFQVPVNPYWSNGTLIPGVDASLPPVGSADDRVMPYSYRFCVVNKPELAVPFSAPAGYAASDFEVLGRYATALISSSKPNGPSIGDLVAQYNYNGYPATAERPMLYDLCEIGTSAVSSDEPTALYGQYITGNRTVRKAVAQRVLYWVQGMMYYLANDPSVPAGTRASTSAWGLCAGAWPDNGHMPPQIYVREGVRLVGDYVSTGNNLQKGVCRPDSVGIGSWTIDVHIMRRAVGSIKGQVSAVNEGAIGFSPLPGNGSTYDMPYSLLLPKKSEVTNLLSPTCPSASHIAFGSIRVEPSFMQLGQAAGAGAAVAVANGCAVQDVPLKQLQSLIVKAGQCVHWPNCTSVGEC